MNRRDFALSAAATLVAGPALARDPLDNLGGIRMPASVVDSQLRGLAATGGRSWWASGAGGWLVRGHDERQDAMRIVGAEDLDFRGLHAFSDDHVVAMSAGPGQASQLWRTRDGGKTWTRIAFNEDPKGFWDTIVFLDARRGYILGDPTEGRFTVLYTADGGETWTRLTEGVPPADDGESAFAASNGCVAVSNRRQVAFCTGGAAKARVYLARGGGGVFVALDTPIPAGAPTRGAFGVAFDKHGALWVCGGDYKAPQAEGVNLARLDPGRISFDAVAAPSGYLSSVDTAGKTVMAAGTSGVVVSRKGAPFQRLSSAPFNTVRLSGDKSGVLCGPGGSIGLWRG